jgi:hypothetical protein
MRVWKGLGGNSEVKRRNAPGVLGTVPELTWCGQDGPLSKAAPPLAVHRQLRFPSV